MNAKWLQDLHILIAIGKQGVHTIYKNHPVGNFRHKHKTIKCTVVRVGITVQYIHIS